jgi:lipid-binding SYLF domain-containing protein
MGVLNVSAIALLCLGLQACQTAALTPAQKEEHRAAERKIARETLEQLYKAHPSARQAVARSAGYAVFSDIGFHIVYGGSEHGSGIAVNNATKRETFMKMFELEPGLGIGVARFRLVLVFETANEFNRYVTSGWEAGAHVLAAAKTTASGRAYAGAMTLSSGVHVTSSPRKALSPASALRAASSTWTRNLTDGHGARIAPAMSALTRASARLCAATSAS